MSYIKLNPVDLPFDLPIPRCDYMMQEIDTEAKYFISVDIDSAYWKVGFAGNSSFSCLKIEPN